MQLPEDEELFGAMSIDGFAKSYNIGRTVTYELIKKKKLRAVKAGKRTLILRRDADAWARLLPELRAIERT